MCCETHRVFNTCVQCISLTSDYISLRVVFVFQLKGDILRGRLMADNGPLPSALWRRAHLTFTR